MLFFFVFRNNSILVKLLVSNVCSDMSWLARHLSFVLQVVLGMVQYQNVNVRFLNFEQLIFNETPTKSTT